MNDASPSGAEGPFANKRFWYVLTLVIGAVGGYLFDLAGVPLAWMIGAMFFTASAAIAGLPVRAIASLRTVMFTILGVMLGATFTPDIVAQAIGWWQTIAVMMVFVVVMTAALSFSFHKLAGMNPKEAVLSATPGGFGEMVLIAESYGADVRTISLIHATRVMFTVMFIPMYFRLFEGLQVPEDSVGAGVGGITVTDGVLMAMCAVFGYLAANKCRVPAAALLGPMVFSAAIHLSGFTEASPPNVVINLAQLVIGANVGCRFMGVARRQLINPIAFGVVGAGVTLGVALGVASVLRAWTGYDAVALWIAFAPGGLPEMTLISLAMGIDTAFVATHHIMRILFIVSGIAFVTRRLFGPPDTS